MATLHHAPRSASRLLPGAQSVAQSVALLIALLGASPALAQDRAPVLDEVQDGTGVLARVLPPGAVAILAGRNLHQCPAPEPDENGVVKPVKCTHEELTVTLDGAPLIVLDSTFDAVTVQFPPRAAPGKCRIKLEIRGRGEAETTIEIVTREDYAEQAKRLTGSEMQGVGGVQRDEEVELLQRFKINTFRMVPGAAGSRFVVDGIAAGIPDRFRLSLTLKYDGRELTSREVPIKDGAFKTTFGPFAKKLLYGIYECELIFSLPTQSGALLRRWERARRRSGEGPITEQMRELYARVLRRELTEVGTGPQGKVTPEDRQRQRDALQTHYQELSSEAAALFDEVERAWAIARRCVYKDPGQAKYHEDKYRKWLLRREFAADDAEADALVRDTTYATASGHFKPTEWETWSTKGDGALLARLAALHKEHVAFNTATICAPDARAQMLGDYLLTIVQRRFQDHSAELYTQSKLPFPDAIGGFALEAMIPPDSTTKFFQAKKRELQRQVGLAVQ